MKSPVHHVPTYTFYTFFRLSLLLVVFYGIICPAAAAEHSFSDETFAIIKIKKRTAKELLPQVKTVLSSNGRASVDIISNAIIISDSAEHIQQAQKLIKSLDMPVPLVNIRLRYHQVSTRSRSLSTAGGISGGRGGLELSSGSFNQEKNLQLTVSSGSSGYLSTGHDIPFTRFWLELCYRYGYRFGWLTEYRRVASGFEVQPVVFGSRVDLKLVPRLAFADSETIRFTEAATRMTIPIDTWVPVSASNFGMDTVSAAILTANGQTNRRAMVLEVRAVVR